MDDYSYNLKHKPLAKQDNIEDKKEYPQITVPDNMEELNQNIHMHVAGRLIDKKIEDLQETIDELRKDIRLKNIEINELKERNNKLYERNNKLENKNDKAARIIADYKKIEKIEDYKGLESELIEQIKENHRLKNHIDTAIHYLTL